MPSCCLGVTSSGCFYVRKIETLGHWEALNRKLVFSRLWRCSVNYLLINTHRFHLLGAGTRCARPTAASIFHRPAPLFCVLGAVDYGRNCGGMTANRWRGRIAV